MALFVSLGVQVPLNEWDDIITAAAQSPLGILALVCLILGVLAPILLKGAPWAVRAALFVMLFGGVFALGLAALGKAKAELIASTPDLCSRFGVALTGRSDRVGLGDSIQVSGDVDSLPHRFQLWIVATPKDSIPYWPRDTAIINGDDWTATISPKLSGRSDRKRFAVFIVGPNGQALIRNYKALKLPSDTVGMTRTTDDMGACPGRHTVTLR
jgi:hypothetical protein